MATILVIEDQLEVRENVLDILQLAGYHAIGAADGKTGIEKATSTLPDLILCDVMMPELDGFGVLSILASRPETCTIPFVFVTAKGEPLDRRRGMNLGADDYITKPFFKDDLLRVIDVRLRKTQRTSFSKTVAMRTGASDSQALEQALNLVLKHRSSKEFTRGEAIYRKGEQVRDIYLLKDGYAKHQMTTDFGKSLIVYVFQPGELFGYPEMIAGEHYQHDTIALTKLHVDLFPVELVKAQLAADPNLADLFLRFLGKGLLDADRRMMNQAYLSVRKRCAETLLRADAVFGQQKWPMSREELSQWAGTAKETFIRNMADLKESNFIKIIDNRIEIVDRDKLSQIPG